VASPPRARLLTSPARRPRRPAARRPLVRLRPLGWELGLFLLALGLVGAGIVTGAQSLSMAAVVLCGVAAPVVIVSFFVRLAAAIIDESRRRRLLRRLT